MTVQRSEPLSSRVARLEEIVLNSKEREQEREAARREDTKTIISRLDALTQTMNSTGNAVATLAVENCGQRLDIHDARLAAMEEKTKDIETVTSDVLFWRKVIGGGFRGICVILGALSASGAAGALIGHLINHWAGQ